jgi:hypothetical protein
MTQEKLKPNALSVIADSTGFPLTTLTDQKYLEYVGQELQKALKEVDSSEYMTKGNATRLANLLEEMRQNEAEQQALAVQRASLEKDKEKFQQKQSGERESISEKGVDATKATGVFWGANALLSAVIFPPLALVDLAGAAHSAYKIDKAKQELLDELATQEKNFNTEQSKQLASIGRQSATLAESLQSYQEMRLFTEKRLTIVQSELSKGRRSERLFGASEALAYCTGQNGSSVVDAYRYGGALQKLVEGEHNLADLETLVKDSTERTIQFLLDADKAEKNPQEFKASLAIQAFVSHVVIPHLDFFVMQAQENEPILAAVQPAAYPTLQVLGQGTYTLNQFPTNLADGLTDSKSLFMIFLVL